MKSGKRYGREEKKTRKSIARVNMFTFTATDTVDWHSENEWRKKCGANMTFPFHKQVSFEINILNSLPLARSRIVV